MLGTAEPHPHRGRSGRRNELTQQTTKGVLKMTLEEIRIERLNKLLKELETKEKNSKAEQEKDYVSALRWAIFELEKKF